MCPVSLYASLCHRERQPRYGGVSEDALKAWPATLKHHAARVQGRQPAWGKATPGRSSSVGNGLPERECSGPCPATPRLPARAGDLPALGSGAQASPHPSISLREPPKEPNGLQSGSPRGCSSARSFPARLGRVSARRDGAQPAPLRKRPARAPRPVSLGHGLEAALVQGDRKEVIHISVFSSTEQPFGTNSAFHSLPIPRFVSSSA